VSTLVLSFMKATDHLLTASCRFVRPHGARVVVCTAEATHRVTHRGFSGFYDYCAAHVPDGGTVGLVPKQLALFEGWSA